MNISRRRDLPLYSQIKEVLREEIRKSGLSEGTYIGTEASLLKRFGVSRITIRRALSDLEAEGLIYRSIGKGTYIRAKNYALELDRLAGFNEDMQKIGASPTARLILSRQEYPTREVERNLKVSDRERVQFIVRIRIANGTAVSVDWSWLPLEIGKVIIQEDLEKNSIYSLIENKLSIRLWEAHYKIGAVKASRLVSDQLDLEEAAPLILIKRTTFTVDGRPIMFEHLHYNPEVISFHLKLTRVHENS